eukprot:scaffold14658_cov67-Phaeocystis_antarctica.AAC.4
MKYTQLSCVPGTGLGPPKHSRSLCHQAFSRAVPWERRPSHVVLWGHSKLAGLQRGGCGQCIRRRVAAAARRRQLDVLGLRGRVRLASVPLGLRLLGRRVRWRDRKRCVRRRRRMAAVGRRAEARLVGSVRVVVRRACDPARDRRGGGWHRVAVGLCGRSGRRRHAERLLVVRTGGGRRAVARGRRVLDGRVAGGWRCRGVCAAGCRVRQRVRVGRVAAVRRHGGGRRRGRHGAGVRGDGVRHPLEGVEVDRLPPLLLQLAEHGDGDAVGGVEPRAHQRRAQVGRGDGAVALVVEGAEGGAQRGAGTSRHLRLRAVLVQVELADEARELVAVELAVAVAVKLVQDGDGLARVGLQLELLERLAQLARAQVAVAALVVTVEGALRLALHLRAVPRRLPRAGVAGGERPLALQRRDELAELGELQHAVAAAVRLAKPLQRLRAHAQPERLQRLAHLLERERAAAVGVVPIEGGAQCRGLDGAAAARRLRRRFAPALRHHHRRRGRVPPAVLRVRVGVRRAPLRCRRRLLRGRARPGVRLEQLRTGGRAGCAVGGCTARCAVGRCAAGCAVSGCAVGGCTARCAVGGCAAGCAVGGCAAGGRGGAEGLDRVWLRGRGRAHRLRALRREVDGVLGGGPLEQRVVLVHELGALVAGDGAQLQLEHGGGLLLRLGAEGRRAGLHAQLVEEGAGEDPAGAALDGRAERLVEVGGAVEERGGARAQLAAIVVRGEEEAEVGVAHLEQLERRVRVHPEGDALPEGQGQREPLLEEERLEAVGQLGAAAAAGRAAAAAACGRAHLAFGQLEQLREELLEAVRVERRARVARLAPEHLARDVDAEAAHRAVHLLELQQAVAVDVGGLEGAAHREEGGHRRVRVERDVGVPQRLARRGEQR